MIAHFYAMVAHFWCESVADFTIFAIMTCFIKKIILHLCHPKNLRV